MLALHVEYFLVLYFGDAHDQQRDQFSKLGDAFPQAQQHGFLEQSENCI